MKNKAVTLIMLLLTWLLLLPLGSFFFNPIILILTGIVMVYIAVRRMGKTYRPKVLISLLFFFSLIILYMGSVSLYLNIPQADFLHEIAAFLPVVRESPSGFNFMINSGIFNLPYVRPEEAPYKLHLLSGVLFTIYPIWLYMGVKLGYSMFKR